MTRKETAQCLAVLRGAYPQFYRSATREEAIDTVNLWSDLFAADDAQIVFAAVKAYIETSEKSFPPTPGEIKGKMRSMLSHADGEMDETEAWNRVAKAIRNSLYGAQEEFDALPADIQRIVGSANMLREWGRMDSETLHSVVASNFRRSYRANADREREWKALPEEAKAAVNCLKAAKSEDAKRISTGKSPPNAIPPNCGEGADLGRELAKAKLEIERLKALNAVPREPKPEPKKRRTNAEVLEWLKGGA